MLSKIQAGSEPQKVGATNPEIEFARGLLGSAREIEKEADGRAQEVFDRIVLEGQWAAAHQIKAANDIYAELCAKLGTTDVIEIIAHKSTHNYINALQKAQSLSVEYPGFPIAVYRHEDFQADILSFCSVEVYRVQELGSSVSLVSVYLHGDEVSLRDRCLSVYPETLNTDYVRYCMRESDKRDWLAYPDNFTKTLVSS